MIRPPLKDKLDAQFTKTESNKIVIEGKSLMHSAPLTARSFYKGILW